MTKDEEAALECLRRGLSGSRVYVDGKPFVAFPYRSEYRADGMNSLVRTDVPAADLGVSTKAPEAPAPRSIHAHEFQDFELRMAVQALLKWAGLKGARELENEMWAEHFKNQELHARTEKELPEQG